MKLLYGFEHKFENSQQHRQVDQTLTHGQMTIQIWLNLFRRPELYTC